ncbi:hypothetical protein [Synechococcus sp. RS9916]|uniref:hypothetical protein n=1 Tax=Synechococcus sp. RS9916 TaxID=221359 RepID=UPI00056DFCEB|nr:hypothetical protein [Synechococcus sp. RS9916]
MAQRESASGTFATLISGAVLGAAGLAWWLLSEAERRQRTKRQQSMLYAPRIQDGSEALESSERLGQEVQLEQRVEQLNAAIADVRRQLEDFGAKN